MKKNKTVIIIFCFLLLIAGYLYYSRKSGTIRDEFSDFAVEDTSSIKKIFLVDNEKKSILLERLDTCQWKVNGKYRARQDAVSVLLTTIKRVSVKTPVPKAAFENVVKQIAGKHVKIEIYQEGEKPSKVYYVGHPNQEHSGTYMLMENSTVPFLMHIEGFRGFLTTRYFTNENEWRSTGIFEYRYGEISTIKLENIRHPEKSFLITEKGINSYELSSLQNPSAKAEYDTAALLQYVALYQKIHFEGFEETKTREFTDSIMNTQPFMVFTVTDKAGNTRRLKTFLKPAREGSTDFEGHPIVYDLDRFYGLVDETDFVVLQYFVFDPLFADYGFFMKKE